MKVQSVKPMVYMVLADFPETRSSDRKLIAQLYDMYYGVSRKPFEEVLGMTDLPSFESIRRARQKLQAEYADLRADKTVEDKRIEKQVEYLEFARGE